MGALVKDQPVSKRSFISLERFAQHTFLPTGLVIASQKESVLRDIALEICCPNAETGIRLIQRSELIDDGHKPLLISSVEYFFDQKE